MNTTALKIGMFAFVSAFSVLVADVAMAQQSGSSDEELTRDLTPAQRIFSGLLPQIFGSAPESVKVLVRTDKKTYQVGDALHLTLSTNKNAYLYVFNKGSSGNTTLLFPNSYQKTALVKINTPVMVPPIKEKWDISVGGPIGVDLIVVLASTEQLSNDEIKKIKTDLKKGEPIAVRSDEEFLRDLKPVIAKKKPTYGISEIKVRVIAGSN